MHRYWTASLSTLGLLTLVLVFFFNISPAHAQSPVPSPSTPFYPLAPCPSCESPSIAPVISGTTSISNTAQYPSPAVSIANPDPEDPCDETASIAHDRKRWGRHHNEKGAIGENMEQLLHLILELINKLIELLGGQPIENPDPDENINEPEVPDGEEPDPCLDENQENNNDEENNNDDEENNDEEEEQETPSASTAPAPSSTVPGISTSPMTSTAPLPSTVMPSGVAPSGAATAGCTQADIQKLVDSVSQENITKLLKELVQDNTKPVPNESVTRAVMTEGNRLKTEWIKQVYESYGLQTKLVPDPEGNSVVATLPGADQNSFYSTGGHLDSTSEDEKNVAPGADDDGSGAVAAMEIARVMASFPAQCRKYSMDFIGFNAEETSMGGSQAYLKSMSGKTIKGHYNMDMIGYAGGVHANMKSASTTVEQPLRDKIVEVNTKYKIGAKLSAGTGDTGTDANSFWDANQPAISFEEELVDQCPCYHTTTDTLDKMDLAQVTYTVKLIVAAMAELQTQ